MTDERFWQKRFEVLGEHSVGPGDTKTEGDLERHRRAFLSRIKPQLEGLKGPVLDFGCGVGRWVMDLPRPYLGLDVAPAHIESCKTKFTSHTDVDFRHSRCLADLPDRSFNSIFTVTVLQHIVEPELRMETLSHFSRILATAGVFLSVEWAEGQRQFDWCTPVDRTDFDPWFDARIVGHVKENGRRHNVWIIRQKGAIVRE